MKRYILFDSGCNTCSKLAQEVEKVTDGWLVARSLRDPEMQRLLNLAKPDWQWKPTLLEVDLENVHAFTGLALRRRLLLKLGVKRTWRIAQVATQLIPSPGAPNMGRRSFLQQGSALLLAVALWPRQRVSQVANSSTTEIVDSVPVEFNERNVLIEQAINSPELRIINADQAFDFEMHEASVVRNTLADGRQEVVVVFTAAAGNFVRYVERSAGYVRHKGEHFQTAGEVGYNLTALAINGKRENLPDGGVGIMQDCAGACGWEYRSGCRPCQGSYIQPTEELCCVCTDPYGHKYVMFCIPYWYGPCGYSC